MVLIRYGNMLCEEKSKSMPLIKQHLRCTRWLVSPLWSDHDGMECTFLSPVRRIELDEAPVVPVGYFCRRYAERHCRQVAQRARCWQIAALGQDQLVAPLVFLGASSSFRCCYIHVVYV